MKTKTPGSAHYRLQNESGPGLIPCAGRPAAEGEEATPVLDAVTCRGCVIALVHQAVSFVQDRHGRR